MKLSTQNYHELNIEDYAITAECSGSFQLY